MYTASHQRFVTLDEMMTRLELSPSYLPVFYLPVFCLPVFYLPVFYLPAYDVLTYCYVAHKKAAHKTHKKAAPKKGSPQPLGDEIITMTKPTARTLTTPRETFQTPRRFFACCDVRYLWGNYGG